MTTFIAHPDDESRVIPIPPEIEALGGEEVGMYAAEEFAKQDAILEAATAPHPTASGSTTSAGGTDQ